MNVRLGFLIFAVGLAISSAAILQPRSSSVNGSERYLKAGSSSSNPFFPPNIQNGDKVWLKVKEYLRAQNIRGLFIYLSSIRETQVALDWLEENHPQVFEAVCWIFDACHSHDIEIPPEVIQKILRFIMNNDFEGLVEYLKTLDEYELLLEWIRSNFPDAWREICQIIDPTKCYLMNKVSV